MNNKSIQILRGSAAYDPLTSDEVLLDGQPFYSKKTKQLYVGEKDSSGNEQAIKDLKPVTANLQAGSAKISTQQKQDGTTGTFDFTNKNPNATALDSSLTGQIPYGAIGEFSASFGGKSSAQGKRSFAAGTTTIAKGNYSTAFGDNSVALGTGSHAEGGVTTASGNASHSEGSRTIASGVSSHAEGDGTIAAGEGSHSEGHNSSTESLYSHVEGYENNIRNSIPSGSGSSGKGSESEGGTTLPDTWTDDTNLGAMAHVEGAGNVAYGVASHAEGKANTVYGHISHAQGDGNTIGSSTDRSAGKASFASGFNNVITGVGSSALGHSNTISSDYSLASGQENYIYSQGALASGYRNTIKAPYSAIIGNSNSIEVEEAESSLIVGKSNNIISAGSYSFICGFNNKIQNNSSVSTLIGNNNIVNYESYSLVSGEGNSASTGKGAFVSGGNNRTYKSYCGAIGYNNMVNSNYSLAVGAGNSNEKDFSFTCGDGCVTQATRSQAFGLDNTAWSANSMVIGQYASGIGVTSTSHLFIVGNGNNVVRRNAFEVLTNGQVFANASPTTNNSVLRLEDIISKVSLNIQSLTLQPNQGIIEVGINNKVFTFTPKSEINFIPKDSSNSTIDFWSSELNEVNGDATLNINGISKNISFILAGTLYYSGGDIVSERASVYITIKLNIDNYAPILIKDPFDDATVNYFNNKEVYIIKSTYGDMDSFRRSSSSTYSIDITKPNPIINCLFYRQGN